MIKREIFVLYLILIAFLLVNIVYLLNQKGIPWDSAVYISMGKYTFSFGKTGLWEPARPILLPILLGFLWKIGLSPIIFGGILELVFSVGCVYLVYIIGKKIFNENIALLSAFFLAFSPTFLFYSSTPLTAIPSTFFALLAIHFFINKRYFLTGLFLGLSFMTRFLQLFTLMAIIFVLILYKKNLLRKIINIVYGLSIIIVPYLLLNTSLYKNPIYPFLFQVLLTKNTGWIFHQPLSFYFINLIKENLLVFFTLIGILSILRKRDFENITILSIFLLFFIFFNSIAHKETRFFLVFLPYMYLIMSYGIFESLKIIRNKGNLFYSIIFIISIIWIFQEINSFEMPVYKEYPEFVSYSRMDGVNEGIWISNPLFIVNSNKKPDQLIYYPIYNSKRIYELNAKIEKANHILIDTCDILPCPREDILCNDETTKFLNSIKKKFETYYYKKETNCEKFIFRRYSK